MLKEKLKVIIKEFHESVLPELVERHLAIDYSLLESPIKKIITIIGPRRAGKTSFLFQIMKNLIAKETTISDIIYINFEDERILPMRTDDLQSVLDAYFELYQDKKQPFIFLDEIQNIAHWEKFVRRLSEQGFRIFLTGSNSRMLGHDIATALRGRTLTYELFPFSFTEFLMAKGVFYDKGGVYGATRHHIRHLFDSYLFSGGYPEIALIHEKATQGKILQEYFNTIFYRDLVDRYKIHNSELLRQWLTTLMANISSLISFKKIEHDYKSRGMKLSGATLSTYARYVEDIYFGFFLTMYSESERKRQVNPKKFYLIDQGMHNHLTLSFSRNRGWVLENLVFLELRRRASHVWYYKTKQGYEVDFLLDENGQRMLIQVCRDVSRVATFAREKRALLAGIKELGLTSGLILTQDEKREEMINGYVLNIMPVWEWLLEKSIL